MKNSIYIILFVILLTSCKFDQKFNRDRWIQHDKIEERSNPRESMVNDLKKNHLKKGMKKEDIYSILGKPYEDGIKCRLPLDVKTPDSLSFRYIYSKDLSKEEKKVKRKQFWQWFETNSQSENISLYPIGWSIIDPRFLAIQYNDDQIVTNYWVEEH